MSQTCKHGIDTIKNSDCYLCYCESIPGSLYDPKKRYECKHGFRRECYFCQQESKQMSGCHPPDWQKGELKVQEKHNMEFYDEFNSNTMEDIMKRREEREEKAKAVILEIKNRLSFLENRLCKQLSEELNDIKEKDSYFEQIDKYLVIFKERIEKLEVNLNIEDRISASDVLCRLTKLESNEKIIRDVLLPKQEINLTLNKIDKRIDKLEEQISIMADNFFL